MTLNELLPLIYNKQEIEIRFKNPNSTTTIYKGTIKDADYITMKHLEAAKIVSLATVKDTLWINVEMEQGYAQEDN